MQQATVKPAYSIADTQSALLRTVYKWMALGLLTTAGVSWLVLTTPALQQIFFRQGVMLALIIGEFLLVGWLVIRAHRMPASRATQIFFAYSAVNGITLAPLAFVYTGQSIASTFMVTAGTFAAMAAYGQMTKRDLSGMGSFLFMGLIGLVLAMIVNIFWQNNAMAFVISVVGVIVFTGLTAYDTNRLKSMGSHLSEGSEEFSRVGICGALSLYLNFINLFLMLLNLMGDRR